MYWCKSRHDRGTVNSVHHKRFIKFITMYAIISSMNFNYLLEFVIRFITCCFVIDMKNLDLVLCLTFQMRYYKCHYIPRFVCRKI